MNEKWLQDRLDVLLRGLLLINSLPLDEMLNELSVLRNQEIEIQNLESKSKDYVNFIQELKDKIEKQEAVINRLEIENSKYKSWSWLYNNDSE